MIRSTVRTVAAILAVIGAMPDYQARRAGAPRKRPLHEIRVAAYAANIRTVLALLPGLTAAGRAWYVWAWGEAAALAHQTGLTLYQAAGVIAAISPGLEWTLNVRAAWYVVTVAWPQGIAPGSDAWDTARGPAPYGYVHYDKALRILNGDGAVSTVRGEFSYATGPKTYSFVRNILWPHQTDHVTIDGHAANVCRHGAVRHGIGAATKGGSISAVEYAEMSAAYADVAAELSLSPDQVQAEAWAKIRAMDLS